MTIWLKTNAIKIVQISIGAIIVGVVGWVTLQSQVTANTDSVKKAHGRITTHIDKSDSAPMSTSEITSQVIEHRNDIKDLEAEDKRISDLQIQLMANQAILVRNNAAVSLAIIQMKEDIGFIKGKLEN